MTHIAKYGCDICNHEYQTQEEAERCERRGQPKPTANVGDIVVLGERFGWYDGDREWIENADEADPRKTGNADAPRKCAFRFYYVVTAVDLDGKYNRAHTPHAPRYHLATLAMKPTSGYHDGFTFDSGHHKPSLVRNPPAAVIRASKKLIGRKADRLI